MPSITTTSDYNAEHIPDINLPFKVEAGAGAGKTHWLIQHIKRILKESNRLNVGKIACISYTTVAAEEIAKRLNFSEQVECSTIHSFLYRNVVKPYFHFIAEDFSNIPQEQIKGHREHVPYLNKVLELILLPMDFEGKEHLIIDDEIAPLYFIKSRLINSVFPNLNWGFNEETNELELKLRVRIVRYENRAKGNPLIELPETSEYYLTYKHHFWSEGVLHHEDVLYFAYKIFLKKPELYKFIAAKFPYVFIDEFQDTISLQTHILKELSTAGATIGVIGDKTQSIYNFAGSKFSDFLEFTVPNIIHLEILDNWRSSESIIEFTNTLSHFNQSKRNDDEGDFPVTICVGGNHIENWERYANHERIGLDLEHCKPQYLVRSNDNAALLRNLLSNSPRPDGFWQRFSENVDSLQEFFLLIAKILTLTKQCKISEAVKTASLIFTTKEDTYQPPLQIEKQKTAIEKVFAVKLVQMLKTESGERNGYELYQGINQLLTNLIKNTSKEECPMIELEERERTFLQSIVALELANNARLVTEPFENDVVQTIHKVKGEEFEAVVICINSSTNRYRGTSGDMFLRNVVNANPNEDNQEEARVYYVAASRAKKHLVFSLEELSSEQEIIIQGQFPKIMVLR